MVGLGPKAKEKAVNRGKREAGNRQHAGISERRGLKCWKGTVREQESDQLVTDEKKKRGRRTWGSATVFDSKNFGLPG